MPAPGRRKSEKCRRTRPLDFGDAGMVLGNDDGKRPGGRAQAPRGAPSEVGGVPPPHVELTEKQPRWRFDLVVLGSENEPMAGAKETKEPSEEDTRQALGDVERMLQAGLVQQALV